jgi:hypothetical protein
MRPSSSNIYDTLSSDENISDAESFVTVTPNGKKKAKLESTAKKNSAPVQKSSHKPPPLNIAGVEYARVNELLTKIRTKVDDYVLSLTSFGVRVFAANTDRYNVLKNELIAAKIRFFTYQLREEQMTKIVLHGLFNMPLNELKTHLADVGVKPANIKAMNIHHKRNNDHAVYLLYFLKSDKIKISSLREIPGVCHLKVRWQYYQNKRNGPMQCSRCMSYGHGGQNCAMNPICIRCGEGHLSSECGYLFDPVSKQPRTRIPDDVVKCGLCGQNHTANFSGCEKRQEFLDRQNRYRARTQRRPRLSNEFVNAPQLENFVLPSLDPRTRASHMPQHQNAPWAANSNDLFTPEELMPIFQEMMGALSRAQSKMEQITVLGQIVIKYSNR